jgi:hypothetical protein
VAVRMRFNNGETVAYPEPGPNVITGIPSVLVVGVGTIPIVPTMCVVNIKLDEVTVETTCGAGLEVGRLTHPSNLKRYLPTRGL